MTGVQTCALPIYKNSAIGRSCVSTDVSESTVPISGWAQGLGSWGTQWAVWFELRFELWLCLSGSLFPPLPKTSVPDL